MGTDSGPRRGASGSPSSGRAGCPPCGEGGHLCTGVFVFRLCFQYNNGTPEHTIDFSVEDFLVLLLQSYPIYIYFRVKKPVLAHVCGTRGDPVKVPVFLRSICRSRAAPTRIPAAFAEIDKLILKLTCKCKGPRVAKTILKKEDTVGGLLTLLMSELTQSCNNPESVVLAEDRPRPVK